MTNTGAAVGEVSRLNQIWLRASAHTRNSPGVVPSNVKWGLPQTLLICLKIKLQRELNKSRVTKAVANLSKPVGVRIDDSTGRLVDRGVKTRTREPKLSTVENVEELGSKLQVSALSDARPLEDGKIK